MITSWKDPTTIRRRGPSRGFPLRRLRRAARLHPLVLCRRPRPHLAVRAAMAGIAAAAPSLLAAPRADRRHLRRLRPMRLLLRPALVAAGVLTEAIPNSLEIVERKTAPQIGAVFLLKEVSFFNRSPGETDRIVNYVNVIPA